MLRVKYLYFRPGEISILLFCLALPFMYYPKVLSGDTQPWILLSLVIAFVTYRIDRFVRKDDIPLIILAIASIAVYALRSDSPFLIARNAYTFITFILLWIVVQRSDDQFLVKAVKLTVVLWFLVGLFQFVSNVLGFQIEVSGRWHKIVKQGPPSLTAEASFYGSLSVVSIMYLLSEKGRSKYFYIVLAFISILISGSLLSVLLLIFPLMRLQLVYKLSGILVLPVFILLDYHFGGAGVSSRLVQIFSSGFNLSDMFSDPSLNLRAGHIYYTLFVSLTDSLLFLRHPDFYTDYNEFANSSGLFIETGSPFVLTSLGEMIYGSGLLAVAIVFLILKRASSTCHTTSLKIQKVGFVIACMLNPISLSNPFLVLYILKKDE